MATMSISVVAGGNTKTVTKTVSSDHLVRFLDAYRAKYAVDGEVLDDNTVIDRWAAEIFNEGKRWTREYERQQSAPGEIAFT